MKAGQLINSLFEISGVSKTDFAIFMNTSPSGLSKILASTRLPPQKEKRQFCKQAASFFCDALWCHHCFTSLQPLFSIIYDFHSKQELEQFLYRAIKYALDIEYAAENDVNFDFPDREEFLIGPHASLDMLCILLSACAAHTDKREIVLYTNVPLFSNTSPNLFDRIIINTITQERRFQFNYLIDPAYLASDRSILDYHFFHTITTIEQHGDLFFWTSDWAAKQPFILIKGQFLLIFPQLPDGSISMMKITHKGYIASFYSDMINTGTSRISYSGKEVMQSIGSNPSFADTLKADDLLSVYAFFEPGLMLADQDFDAMQIPDGPKKSILKLYQQSLRLDKSYYISQDACTRFYQSGKIIIPLVGIYTLPEDQRLGYLNRFSDFISSRTADTAAIQASSLSNLFIINYGDYSLLYLADRKFSFEKIHIFKTGAILKGLKRERANGRFKEQNLTPELWRTMLEELAATKQLLA